MHDGAIEGAEAEKHRRQQKQEKSETTGRMCQWHEARLEMGTTPRQEHPVAQGTTLYRQEM
jgi:hypothetical protein